MIRQCDDAWRRLDTHEAHRWVLGQYGVLQLNFTRCRTCLQMLIVTQDNNAIRYIHIDLVVIVPRADHSILIGKQQILVRILSGCLDALGYAHLVVNLMRELCIVVKIVIQPIEHWGRRLWCDHTAFSLSPPSSFRSVVVVVNGVAASLSF